MNKSSLLFNQLHKNYLKEKNDFFFFFTRKSDRFVSAKKDKKKLDKKKLKVRQIIRKIFLRTDF